MNKNHKTDYDSQENAFLKQKISQNKESVYSFAGIQGNLFDISEFNISTNEILGEIISENYVFNHKEIKNRTQLQNRRYIGNKYKLIKWIFSIINSECNIDYNNSHKTFTDIFAGTGVISAIASIHFDNIVLNDLLYSNFVIYQAFFNHGEWDRGKIESTINEYNNIDFKGLKENYFSVNFGGKYFSEDSSKIIGFIREDIENKRAYLTDKEYYVLLTSLLYAVDKIANTVGHYDAYFKKELVEDNFFITPIEPIEPKDVFIYREDANKLAKRIKSDVVYIDPPYNSRQYSRFYHVLETLTKWDKPKLTGVALKPELENMSDYCRVQAKYKFAELIKDLDAKYLVVSYNNTYKSKSNSSRNKITLNEINDILKSKGNTKIFEKPYRHFNAGNTCFADHKEYLFITKVGNE